MQLVSLISPVLLIVAASLTAWIPQTVTCEGTYPKHLQGVCVDGEFIYWCFTTELVKTDRSGKRLKQIPVADHHGDLCLHSGRLYVAVNLGKFNDPHGNADSWVYEYNAETLQGWLVIRCRKFFTAQAESASEMIVSSLSADCRRECRRTSFTNTTPTGSSWKSMF
jgi:hypothetical protein